jgi:PhnB protein
VQINPYLHCNGQCEAAFKFYEKVLGAKIDGMFTFGDSPMAKEVPSDWQKKVMHARMTVNGNVLMGADASSECYQRPQDFSVSIGAKEPEEAERVFKELAQNGTVQMPIQKTFWSARFGMLADQFGIPWMVNCEQAA